MENMEKITLYDENDNPCEYELIDLFELKGNVYGGFAPVLTEENADDEEIEVVMLKVLERDGKELFSEIESEEEEAEAFSELVRRQEETDDE